MCNFYNQKSGQAVEFTYEAYRGQLLKGQGNTSKGCPKDVAHPFIQIQELDLMFIHQFMHGITDFFSLAWYDLDLKCSKNQLHPFST